MSKKRKVRIVVRANDHPCELFSIIERKNKDIIISVDGEVWSQGVEGVGQVLHDHYSIHSSPKSTGVTITRKKSLADNYYTSNASFIEGSKDEFCWPVFSKICSIMSVNQYFKIPRRIDKIIHIDDYDQKFSSIIFHVIAAGVDSVLPKASYHNDYRIFFDRFQIGIYWTYLNCPAIPYYFQCGPSTSPTHVNGIPRPGERIASMPVGEKEFGEWLEYSLVALTQSYFSWSKARVLNMPTLDIHLRDEIIKGLDEHIIWYSAKPFNGSL